MGYPVQLIGIKDQCIHCSTEEKNPWCIRSKCFEFCFVALSVLHYRKAVCVKYFLADPSVDLLYNNGQYLDPRLGCFFVLFCFSFVF